VKKIAYALLCPPGAALKQENPYAMRRAGFGREKLNYRKPFCYDAVAPVGRNRGPRYSLIRLQGIRREGWYPLLSLTGVET